MRFARAFKALRIAVPWQRTCLAGETPFRCVPWRLARCGNAVRVCCAYFFFFFFFSSSFPYFSLYVARAFYATVNDGWQHNGATTCSVNDVFAKTSRRWADNTSSYNLLSGDVSGALAPELCSAWPYWRLLWRKHVPAKRQAFAARPAAVDIAYNVLSKRDFWTTPAATASALSTFP